MTIVTTKFTVPACGKSRKSEYYTLTQVFDVPKELKKAVGEFPGKEESDGLQAMGHLPTGKNSFVKTITATGQVVEERDHNAQGGRTEVRYYDADQYLQSRILYPNTYKTRTDFKYIYRHTIDSDNDVIVVEYLENAKLARPAAGFARMHFKEKMHDLCLHEAFDANGRLISAEDIAVFNEKVQMAQYGDAFYKIIQQAEKTKELAFDI